MTVKLTASKLTHWFRCYQNMICYGEKDKHPLLDVIQSSDGTKLRVYLQMQSDSGNEKTVD